MNRQHVLASVALALFLGGWVLPAIMPPYGVALASAGWRHPLWYWNYVCVGGGQFFSQATIVESTWEDGTHGHNFLVGPCLPATLLGLWLPVSAGLLVLWPAVSTWVARAWVMLVDPLLIVLGLHQSYTPWRFPWETGFLVIITLLFGLLALIIRRRWRGADKYARQAMTAVLAMSFYPLWIGALALTQGVMPAVGWLLMALGCGLLIWRQWSGRVATTESVLVSPDTGGSA